MGWDVALFMLAASYLIQMALAPKQQVQPPAAMEDIEFPQAEEGTPQAVIFGDCWCADWTVLAVGNYRTTEIKKSA